MSMAPRLGDGRKRSSQLPAVLLAFVVLPSLLFMGACGKDCDDSPTACATAATTTTTATSSLNPATTGQAVTFTGTIASSGNTPTGTVTFLDGTTKLGTGTLSSGKATFQTSSLTAGTHSITVSYAGATDFAASTSSALTETVTGGGTPAGTYTIPINAVGTAGTNNGNTGTQPLTVGLTVQ